VKTVRYLQGERGFTLVELMLSILLLSILFLTAWGIFGQSFIFWKQGEYNVDMYDSLRISQNRLGRELKCARKITVSSNSNNLYFINSEGRIVKYYCSSDALYRQEQGAVPQPLVSDIESIGFAYVDEAGVDVNDVLSYAESVRLVKITITAKKQGSKVRPVTLIQMIRLRALS